MSISYILFKKVIRGNNLVATVYNLSSSLKVILCASEQICSIVRYCFRSFKKIHYIY